VVKTKDKRQTKQVKSSTTKITRIAAVVVLLLVMLLPVWWFRKGKEKEKGARRPTEKATVKM